MAMAWLLSPGLVAAQDLRLAVDPAWGGRFLAGGETEIGVELSADTGGAYLIRIASAGFHVEQRGSLEAGLPVMVALPVRPAPDGRVLVHATGPGGRSVSQTIDLQPVAAALRVQVATDRSPDRLDGASLQASPLRLPRTLSGYGPVGQLFLDRRAVSQLDEAQRQALTAYIGRCGALQLAADAQDFLVPSLALAGCGAAQFSDSGEVAPPPQAASAVHARLRTLLDSDNGILGARWLMLAFGFYVLVLIALPRSLRTPQIVTAVAVTASLVIWAYAAWRAPNTQGVVVVEAPSGAEQGRLSAVLRLHGDGLKPLSVAIDGRLSAPLALDAADTALAWLPDPAPHFRIDATPPLLGAQDYALHGAAPLRSRPLVRVGSEAVELVNAGSQPIAAGMLAFANGVVATPPLEPGSRWTADADAPMLGWTPVTGLLREMGLHDRATWMLPLAENEVQSMAPLSRRSAWLVIHAPGSVL